MLRVATPGSVMVTIVYVKGLGLGGGQAAVDMKGKGKEAIVNMWWRLARRHNTCIIFIVGVDSVLATAHGWQGMPSNKVPASLYCGTRGTNCRLDNGHC